MPKYDYKCNKCEEVFEIVKSMSDPHPTECECGGNLNQIFATVGVAFKGNGFYRTDNAKKKS